MAVALHPLERLGHGWLFDPDPVTQLPLCQPVHFEQGEQLGELPWDHAMRCDAGSEGLRQ